MPSPVEISKKGVQMKHTLFPYKSNGKWVVESWADEHGLFDTKFDEYKHLLGALWEYQKRVKQK